MYASLTTWDGMNAPEFTGLENYQTLIADDGFFREALGNTIYFTLGHIPLTIVFALGLALLCILAAVGVTWRFILCLTVRCDDR